MIKKDEAINKIIDYSLYKNKQNSDMYIRFVSNNIKRCEKEIAELRQEQTIFNTREIAEQIKELQGKIKKYYLDIEKEIENNF